MHFPDFDTLKRWAPMREFREPLPNEAEAQYREAFADYMIPIDRVESAEIRAGKAGFNGLDARSKLAAMGIRFS